MRLKPVQQWRLTDQEIAEIKDRQKALGGNLGEMLDEAQKAKRVRAEAEGTKEGIKL